MRSSSSLFSLYPSILDSEVWITEGCNMDCSLQKRVDTSNLSTLITQPRRATIDRKPSLHCCFQLPIDFPAKQLSSHKTEKVVEPYKIKTLMQGVQHYWWLGNSSSSKPEIYRCLQTDQNQIYGAFPRKFRMHMFYTLFQEHTNVLHALHTKRKIGLDISYYYIWIIRGWYS
jgi:hypothetical protein